MSDLCYFQGTKRRGDGQHAARVFEVRVENAEPDANTYAEPSEQVARAWILREVRDW